MEIFIFFNKFFANRRYIHAIFSYISNFSIPYRSSCQGKSEALEFPLERDEICYCYPVGDRVTRYGHISSLHGLLWH